MYRLLTLLMIVGLLLLSACGGPESSAPTPESWTPPSTAIVAAPATPSPQIEPTAAAGAAVAAPPATTAAPVTTYTVQRGAVSSELKLEGQVVAAQQQELSFSEGGILQAIHVENGSAIKQGQLLAELDAGDLTAQLQQGQGAYDKAKHALDIASQEQQIAVGRAQIDVNAAKAKLARLQGPPDPVEVRKARAAIVQAQAKLDKTRNDASEVKNQAGQKLKQAQHDLEAAQLAYSAADQNVHAVNTNKKSQPVDKTAAQAQLDKARTDLRDAQATVDSQQIEYDTAYGNEIALVHDAEASLAIAQAELDGLLNGPNREQLDEAKQGLQVATLALDEARLHASPDPDLSKSVKDAQQNVKDIQKQIDALRLYAPFNGQIVTISAQEGATIEPHAAFISAIDSSIDPSELQIQTSGTSDPNASALTVGRLVKVVFPRSGDKTIPGTIAQVLASQTSSAAASTDQPTPASQASGADQPTPASQASGSATSTDQHYIVRFEATDLQLAAGDQAQVIITLAHKDNALWLPPQALRTEDQTYVIVQHGSDKDRVAVQVGIKSLDRVEILEGLKEGDVVIGQ